MNLWLVVPVKPFDESKSRLAAILARQERAALTRSLLTRTLHVAQASGHFARLLVVSRDDAVLAVAAAAGAATLAEAGADLNRALRQGCDHALRQGAEAALILPADLPLLTMADLDRLAEAAAGAGLVLAPSQDGGTNALLLRLPLPMPLCFGPDSFRRHQQAAAARRLTVAVCATPSLAFDLDWPEDLAALRHSGTTGTIDQEGLVCQGSGKGEGS